MDIIHKITEALDFERAEDPTSPLIQPWSEIRDALVAGSPLTERQQGLISELRAAL